MKRLLACALVAIPALALAAPDPDVTPAPYQAATPRGVEARVVALRMQGDHAVITLSAGANAGIGKDWRGIVLRGLTHEPLAAAQVTIVRVDERGTIARVKLTAEQVAANPRVRFSPPTE